MPVKQKLRTGLHKLRRRKGEIIPVSKFYKEVHNKLKSEFGDKDFSVVSSDDNDNKFLVVVSSDKLYGTYYEYDTKTKN